MSGFIGSPVLENYFQPKNIGSMAFLGCDIEFLDLSEVEKYDPKAFSGSHLENAIIMFGDNIETFENIPEIQENLENFNMELKKNNIKL